MTRRVFMECTGYMQSGARYRVTDEEGRELVASTRVPEFDAARALLAKGVTGRLEVWRASATYPAVVLDIERAAGLTVSETDRDGLQIVKWQPGNPSAIGECGEDRPTGAGMALDGQR
jgi:hypothetical protein